VRALLQRVSRAAVRVEGEEVAAADRAGAEVWLAERCAGLRVFEDGAGKMNLSVRDVDGEALVVSQFTLYADTTRGRRPGFEPAARPEGAERAYERFCDALAAAGVPTRRGRFGARMEVELVNAGPATFLLETPEA
jgi:D-tyrosyl-tRNA(Tyr) deacylase